ncbi:MAG: hypothetical protein AAB423_02870 [Patescibacteria group bacterium]
MEAYSVPAHEKSDQRRREDVFERLPQVTPILDMWADHLEFWDRNGGFDATTQEEIDQARESIITRTEEIIKENFPSDINMVDAYVNLALHTAIGIRKESLTASMGEIS